MKYAHADGFYSPRKAGLGSFHGERRGGIRLLHRDFFSRSFAQNFSRFSNRFVPSSFAFMRNFAKLINFHFARNLSRRPGTAFCRLQLQSSRALNARSSISLVLASRWNVTFMRSSLRPMHAQRRKILFLYISNYINHARPYDHV